MSDLRALIALSRVHAIGPILSRTLISYCGSAAAVWNQTEAQLSDIPGVGRQRAQSILTSRAREEAHEIWQACAQLDIRCIDYLNPEFPKRLAAIPDAPLLLYVRGELNLQAPRVVAIVGTRNPSEYGTLSCERIVEELQEYNCQIISGLAYGIDATAHRSALKRGMETIAILGNGLDRIYPAAHRDMAEKMCGNGGLISEFIPGTGPDRQNFPMRNRVIAGMCDALLVVESKQAGGSMISGNFAFDYSRDVFALPGRADDPLSAGPNALIRQTKASLCTSGGDIARAMMWSRQGSMSGKQARLLLDLDEQERAIVEKLQQQPKMNIDALSYATEMTTTSLSAILLSLEFKGIVKSLPGKRYILA